MGAERAAFIKAKAAVREANEELYILKANRNNNESFKIETHDEARRPLLLGSVKLDWRQFKSRITDAMTF